jgi:hypothetical protein
VSPPSNAEDLLHARAGALSYEDARRYVESRGWVRITTRRTEVAVFRLGDHEVHLPMDTSLRDYASAMALFARSIGDAEGRSPEQVLADLGASRVDRHRPARVGGNEPEGASLEAATAMLDGIRRALLASACSVLQPRAFHPRMSLGDAEAFVAQTRFAHTEVGSFVMVVDTPTEVDGARQSFGRDASLLLMRSLAELTAAVRAGAAMRLLDVDSDRPQVSANLCEAILRMAPPSEAADLRFAVSWSPLVAPPPGLVGAVTVDRHMYETIERLATQLRPSESSVAGSHIGFVKELKGGPGPTGQPEGEVVMTLVLEDETVVRARAQLDAPQYATAIEAHARSHFVVVQGELHRVRKGHELREVREIALK